MVYTLILCDVTSLYYWLCCPSPSTLNSLHSFCPTMFWWYLNTCLDTCSSKWRPSQDLALGSLLFSLSLSLFQHLNQRCKDDNGDVFQSCIFNLIVLPDSRTSCSNAFTSASACLCLYFAQFLFGSIPILKSFCGPFSLMTPTFSLHPLVPCPLLLVIFQSYHFSPWPLLWPGQAGPYHSCFHH